MRADLPNIDASSRVDAVRAQLEMLGHQAMLVRNHSNLAWLTGFTGSNGWAVVTSDRLILATDGRYLERAREELQKANAELQTKFLEAEKAKAVAQELAKKAALAKDLAEKATEDAKTMTMGSDLAEQVLLILDEDPSISWDAAVARIVEAPGGLSQNNRAPPPRACPPSNVNPVGPGFFPLVSSPTEGVRHGTFAHRHTFRLRLRHNGRSCGGS